MGNNKNMVFKKQKFLYLIFLFAIWFFINTNKCYAQHYQLIKTFTTADGLPSNHIYKIVEDNNGFLWIATDNGLCRFDGKYFQTFTIKDGLPDNEVLNIEKDNDGTIWINCFKNIPSYFDEKLNKIVCATNVKNENTGSIFILNKFANGDIAYKNEHRMYLFKNRKLQINSDLKIINIYNNDEYLWNEKILLDKITNVRLTLFSNNKEKKSINYQSPNYGLGYYFNDNKYYLGYKNYLKIIYPNNGILQMDSIAFKVPIFKINFNDKNIFINYNNGNVEVRNKNNFELIDKIITNKFVNTSTQDSFNNVWIGTSNNGLMLYKKEPIEIIAMPKVLKQNNFISVTALPNSNFIAGNYIGEVLESKNQKLNYHQLENLQNILWIRKSICVKNKNYVFTDNNCFVNYQRIPNNIQPKLNLQGKSAVLANDSTILVVQLNIASCLYKLNIANNKAQLLNCKYYRASVIKKYNNNFFYIGTNNKLLKYNLLQDSTYSIFDNEALLQNRIVDIAVTNDSLICVATSNNDLVILQNDKIIKVINNKNGLFANILSLATSPQKIWVGTRDGIYIINYQLKNQQFNFTSSNITENNGLPNNIINDLSASLDTMYVATAKGLAKVPLNFKNAINNIPIYLTNININQEEQQIATTYNLKKGTKFIQMQFAGVNLNGNFHHLIYALNDNTQWYNIDGNELNIQIKNGKNNLFVNAVDVNGNISKNNFQICFNVAIPIYERNSFWVILASILTALIIWFFQNKKIKKAKNQLQLQLELEDQRQKITADLHDDIGASLSSLQLNSAIAKQLVLSDGEQAKKILSKIENQSKKISETISDIIWSMKPGKNELMTISSRIKTFAVDILSATNIEYEIQVDKKIDTVVSNFSARKNIVYIVKEAINNAVKYSNAKKITIHIFIKNYNLEIQIKDDGIGFENKIETGNGLQNMQKRSEELNGLFSINSIKNKGTTIHIILPIPTINDKK